MWIYAQCKCKENKTYVDLYKVCVCVCVRVCARARACVCACRLCVWNVLSRRSQRSILEMN